MEAGAASSRPRDHSGRPLAALLLAVLLLPLAGAQGGEGGGVRPSLRVETLEGERSPLVESWLLVGHENLLNLTILNMDNEPWRGAFRVDLTGASTSMDTVAFDVPAGGRQTRLVPVRPDGAGVVEARFESIDATYPGGGAFSPSLSAIAVLAPSVRFVDPPIVSEAEEPGFQRVAMRGGNHLPHNAYLRVPPGVPVEPKLEVRNDLDVATAPFQLRLMGSRGVGPVDVRALEPGESLTITLPEFQPIERQLGRGYFGPIERLELRPVGEFDLGDVQANAHLASYRVEGGAVADVSPATATIDVQEGLVVELLAPRAPQLGAPTRVRLALANEGREFVRGTITVTLQTPHEQFYEVDEHGTLQGPTVHVVPVALPPGERDLQTVEFTPRVTGSWVVTTLFRSAGFGSGYGGASFVVPGPVRILDDAPGALHHAGIGGKLRLDFTVLSERVLQGAALRVATSAGSAYDGGAGGRGSPQPGFTQRLLEVESSTATLGTLRPGGAVNATLEVAARSSGRYSVVPYVLAENFAFTSQPYDPAVDPPEFANFGEPGFLVAVQPRPVPAALGLAPLTLGLALFVGMWTFRPRLVK